MEYKKISEPCYVLLWVPFETYMKQVTSLLIVSYSGDGRQTEIRLFFTGVQELNQRFAINTFIDSNMFHCKIYVENISCPHHHVAELFPGEGDPPCQARPLKVILKVRHPTGPAKAKEQSP